MLNIRFFVIIALLAGYSTILYGASEGSFPLDIFAAIEAGKNFANLTPAQERACLPQINARGVVQSWYFRPLEFAAVCRNSRALRWLVAKGCLKESPFVLQVAIDRYQNYSIPKACDDLDVIAFLLENGAKTIFKMKVSGNIAEIEALSYAKAALSNMRSATREVGFLLITEADLRRQEQLVALLERFELLSPARAAWMGAVYKGSLVRASRAAGAGAGPSGMLASAKRVKCLPLAE